MSACSPQRFLANNRNLFRTATITASSVLPVANQVRRLPFARKGTAQAVISGSYTGAEERDIDIEIIDTDVEVARVSQATRSGAGSATITDIEAAGPQQTFTLECQSASIEGAAASATIEGATVEAAVEGTSGNAITITVDQSGLVYTATTFTLLADLAAGQGSQSSPLVGQAFDWNTVQIANGQIPTTALRIAFADDPSRIYTNYKDFLDGEFKYFLVPALTRSVPRGTPIQTVTGGRTVAVTNGVTTETTTAALPGGVITAFDFLNWVRTESALLVVTTPVSNDRTPTGLAAREFSLRTDAHAEVSYGTGTPYATGLEDVTVAADAGTQLVTFTCFANNPSGHPLAHLGAEKWNVRSSLLGDLGTVTTGIPYSEPSGAFGATIPIRVPLGYGEPRGRFALSSITYANGSTEPQICPVALTLGPNAVDQRITLVYETRPSEDCECKRMPVPNLNTSCLGNPAQGGSSMAYATDTIARLVSLHSWYTELVRDMTTLGVAGGIGVRYPATEADVISNPIDAQYYDTANAVLVAQPYNGSGFAKATESLRTLVGNFEATLARVDPITPASPPGLREAGNTAWDAAVAEFQADIAGAIGSPSAYLMNVPSDRYDARLNFVLISAGIPTVGGADASTIESGDGCWRDLGGSAWWRVYSSVYGELAPLFTNAPYYSARKTANNSGYYADKQFAMQLNVKCVDQLLDDDTVVLDIAAAGFPSTYQIGDELNLPIVAATPLQLTGGITGAPIQTWTNHGSVSGPLPPYLFDPTAPVAYEYDSGGSPNPVILRYLLVEGGIPTEKGDRFRLAIEGGHYRWRYTDGAWQDASPPRPIPLTTDLLDDGLSVSFTTGAAASFVLGDVHKFRALQPWAVSNTRTPNRKLYKWDGATADYEGDFGEVLPITMFAMLHDLPEGATITLWGGAAAANEWSEVITWRAGASWKVVDHSARYVKIALANATGGSIQWPFAGVPVSTTLSAEVQLTRVYRENQPGGNLQGGRFIGKAIDADVSWSEAALPEVDATALIEMLDHCKTNNNEALILIPQVDRTADPVIIGRINSNAVEFTDPQFYGERPSRVRRVSCQIPIEGELQ